jgi:hypothetical protein
MVAEPASKKAREFRVSLALLALLLKPLLLAQVVSYPAFPKWDVRGLVSLVVLTI